MATDIWAYQGKYRGHVWQDTDAELSFAMSDLEHAYTNLIDVPLTASAVSKAQQRMDAAMDRIARVIAKVKRERLAAQAA